MSGMLALRYGAVLAIAVWAGGLLALGAIVAPAIFDVVALRQVPEGRVLAGAIFGEAFRRFHLVGYGCGAVLLLSLGIRAILGPRPRRFAVRFGIAALMLAASLYSGSRDLAIDREHSATGWTRSRAVEPARDRSATRRVRPAARACRR